MRNLTQFLHVSFLSFETWKASQEGVFSGLTEALHSFRTEAHTLNSRKVSLLSPESINS